MEKNMHGRSPFEAGLGARSRRRAVCSAIILAALACPAAVGAATLRLDETVMSGLANPRGLAFGPDGALYVAEAGSGGAGPTITAGSGQEVSYGRTGAVSRLRDGTQERIVEGLPSLAGATGGEATGPQDVAFDAGGTLHAVIGLGADPAARDVGLAEEQGATLLGTLVRLGSDAPAIGADLAAFEAANDPDGAGPDSNPFGLAARGDGFLVTDAGGNDVLAVGGSGAISVEAVLAPAPNPLFPEVGGPSYQAVPTGAALAPNGALLFGQLTGFPFPEGAAQVFSLDGDNLSIAASGLTNIIDVAFGTDGTLYTLELDSDGLLAPGTTGALYSIGADGTAQLLFGNLEAPTGLAIGADGKFLVSVNGFSPTDGRVIQLAPVPLPAALPAFMSGLVLLGAWRFRKGAGTTGSLRT